MDHLDCSCFFFGGMNFWNPQDISFVEIFVSFPDCIVEFYFEGTKNHLIGSTEMKTLLSATWLVLNSENNKLLEADDT